MKKILFVLFAVAFAASLCFAQDSNESSTSTSQSVLAVSQAETKSFTGKVNFVSVGNADEGTKPQITVTDDSGQNLNFVIDSIAIITDKDGNMIDPGDIKNGTKVTVTYTTDTDGTNKVQYIKTTE